MKDYKSYYRELARNNKNTLTHNIVLAAFKALNARSNSNKLDIFLALLARAFTPVTNSTKLANGSQPYHKVAALLSGGRWYYSNGDIAATLMTVVQSEISDDAEIVKTYRELFKAAFEKINGVSRLPETHYSYVFVDPNLSASQRIVQTNHATIELGYELAKQNISVKELHLVLCPLDSSEELELVLETNKIANIKFQEPDLGNQITAIATWPIARSQKGVLKKFPILT